MAEEHPWQSQAGGRIETTSRQQSSHETSKNENAKFNATLFVVPLATSPVSLALNPQKSQPIKDLDHGSYGDRGT